MRSRACVCVCVAGEGMLVAADSDLLNGKIALYIQSQFLLHVQFRIEFE